MPPACATPWRAKFVAVRLGALALLLTRAASAQAQLEFPPVEIVAERPDGSVRAPAAQTTTVEASRFAGEARSVAELLQTAPGVSIRSLGPGQQATFSLRGATADESLVLLDGIPLRGPGGGAIDLATLPATLLDRLVVSRGVLGAQFGAGALGGVVEIVPRAPRGDGGGGRIAVGSFGAAQLSADGEVKSSSGGGIASVQLDTTSGGYPYVRQATPEIPASPSFDYVRSNADAHRGSALLRWAQQLAPQAELDAIVQGSIGARGLPGPSTATTPRSRALDQGGLAGLRLRRIDGDLAWSARVWARVERIELRGVQVIGDCADGAPGCPRTDERATEARAEIETGYPLGASNFLRATLAGGEEWVAGAPTGPHRRGSGSLAILDDVRLGERISLHPALRLEAVGTTVALSPGIAATFRPFRAGVLSPLELRAGAGASFRPPTLSELYVDQAGIDPNPDLVAERAWSADAGVRYQAGPLAASVGIFASRYDDLIAYELNPPFRVKPRNVGLARVAGLETQVVLLLPRGFVAEASYSHLDAVNLRQGERGGHLLAYRPPHRIFGRLARQGDRVEGFVQANYTAAMPRNEFETAFLPAQFVLDAGAGVRVAGPLWIDLEARNLLDDRTHEDLFHNPLPGLTLAALARARF